MRTKHRKQKVNVITLGCSKNLVDSEVMMGQLRANKFDVEHEKENDDSNIVIINTCGFIDNAKQESINTILEYAELKQQGEIEKLYVTGCLSERYRNDLKTEMPQVDAWFGTMELPQLLSKLGADYKKDLVGERQQVTPPHYAYLKISEGCNRTCAFCAIPLMRGKHVSKPIEEIISEAEKLVKRGVKELMLIAQELTYYGLDIYKERKLAELLEQLSDVEGLKWIRLHYAYPSKFPEEILEVVRAKKNICNYIDIPFQHVSNNMLQRMRRLITKEETIELIKTIRSKVPGIAIRTTFLVGFPGETEKDVDELVEFVREMKFDRAGVFTYSHEEGTAAFEVRDDVPRKVKAARAARVMKAQEDVSFDLNQLRIGKTLEVLIDREEGGYLIGRTEYDSPEVDNEVMIDAKEFSPTFIQRHIGEMVSVKITDASEFDLTGKIVSTH